ncbi:MAG: glycosyltransferase family 4 protein [Candidatus Omnitrophica bacterium]|nr:glycosyltransferase family 4 protein [Candidatus Omnitrophota bacterium]
MNILYLHRTQGSGVEGVHIRETVKALRALGHAVDVISPPGISVFDEPAASTPVKRPMRRLWRRLSRRLPELWFEGLEVAYNGYAACAMARRLRSRSYDFLYERYAIFNWAGLAQARRCGLPVILEVNYTSRSPLARGRHRGLKRLARAIDQRVFQQADGMAVVSTALRQHLIADFGVDERKVIVLPNAADPSVFSPSAANGDGEVRLRCHLGRKHVVGFSGRFLPWHGVELLVRAIPRILREAGETAFLFIGDGPQRQMIEAQLRALGLSRHAVFVGEVAHAQLPRYLAACDVAVLPHSNDYGSPMKLFEYMAMGKPTVAPRYSPLEDVIAHGQDGWLFEPGNAEALAQGLITLLTDDALRQRMGASARAKIIQERNWLTNARAIQTLYEQVAGARGRRPHHLCCDAADHASGAPPSSGRAQVGG